MHCWGLTMAPSKQHYGQQKKNLADPRQPTTPVTSDLDEGDLAALAPDGAHGATLDAILQAITDSQEALEQKTDTMVVDQGNLRDDLYKIRNGHIDRAYLEGHVS
ncbi:hypothetical protein NDU88_005830 [Pleurodeles waltl]|uniref:Uncharacterized protein n=1 Tax=Pleurodeles waltl TaxID=8319 RepID=A0AAV7WCY8_PLEWA|nr:hypothetical protein NDU88_005830 [Pleurodeles waltl]